MSRKTVRAQGRAEGGVGRRFDVGGGETGLHPGEGRAELGDEMEAAAGGAGVGIVGAGDGLEDVAAIFGGAGDGADLIHGPGERHGAGAADQAIGGAQAGDAAEGARHGNGTPGFRAQREGDEAGGDGGGGTGAGASGPARGIPGVEAGAGERGRGEAVAAGAGELDHAELGAEQRAGARELMDHRRVFLEDLVAEGRCAPRGREAGGAEQILGAVGNALQGTAEALALEFGVDERGFVERETAQQQRQGVVARRELRDAVAEGGGQLAGGEFTLPQAGVEAHGGVEENIHGGWGHVRVGSGRRARFPEGAGRGGWRSGRGAGSRAGLRVRAARRTAEETAARGRPAGAGLRSRRQPTGGG